MNNSMKTRILQTEITIPVSVKYSYEAGERMTGNHPGSPPSVDIDKITIPGPDPTDIYGLLPQGVLNALLNECWKDLKI